VQMWCKCDESITKRKKALATGTTLEILSTYGQGERYAAGSGQAQFCQPFRQTQVHILFQKFLLHLLNGYVSGRGSAPRGHRRGNTAGLSQYVA